MTRITLAFSRSASATKASAHLLSNRRTSDSYFQGGFALAFAFATGSPVGPDRLYFDDSDVTTASVDGFDER